MDEEEGERTDSILRAFVDAYAELADSLLSGIVDLLRIMSTSGGSLFMSMVHFAINILWIPVNIITFLLTIASYIFKVVTFPAKIFFNVASTFPVFSLLMILSTVLFFYTLRKVASQGLVQWFMYTFVPYCSSIFFTVLGIFVPQVNTAVNIFHHMLHPIQWLINFINTVRRRADTVHGAMEALSPRSTRSRRSSTSSVTSSVASIRRSPRIASHSGTSPTAPSMDCVICLSNEKNVLFRPCNHMAVCSECLDELLYQAEPACPLCRSSIESHMQVYY